MKTIFTKASVLLIIAASLFNTKANAQTVVFKENFDTVSVLPSQGWEMINKSNPLGAGEWRQGNYLDLGAYGFSGNGSSYIEADWTSTGTLGTISDWLLTPTIMLQNYDTVTFYAVSYNSYQYPDRLELRMSAMGTSDSVGVNDTTVGYFSTLLVSINPNLDTFSFPSIYGGGADSTWKKFTGVVTGLTGITNCRLGFRYFVTDAGDTGVNSSTIGVDSLLIMRVPYAGIAENTADKDISIYPNPAKDNLFIKLTNGNYLVNIYNVLGECIQTFKTENSRTVDVSLLPQALYSVQVIDIKTGISRTIPFVKE
jgi:hypothetical protein